MTAAFDLPDGSRHPTEALSALLDGELSGSEADSVERHLAACADCRAEMGRLAEARDRLRTMELLAVPLGMTERARARVRWLVRAVTVGALVTGAGSAIGLWAARPDRTVAVPVPATLSVFVAAGAPEGAGTGPRPASVPLGHLPPGYVAPADLDGLELESVWVSGQVLATEYGDGAGAMTVLEQLGRLDPSGAAVVLSGRRGVLTRWDSRTVFTSQDGSVVVTIVGDLDSMPGAVTAFARLHPRPPWPYRARSICRSLIEDLTGG